MPAINLQTSQVSLNRRTGDDFRIEIRRPLPFFEKVPGRSPGTPFALSFFPFFRRF
jgi:hypothetical protein